jgi:GWxTD domain-containing protein
MRAHLLSQYPGTAHPSDANVRASHRSWFPAFSFAAPIAFAPWAAVLLVLGSFAASSVRAAPGWLEVYRDSLAKEIKVLRREARGKRDVDTTRYKLACALRDTRTVEGRAEAIGILDALQRSHPDDDRIALMLARVYLDSGQKRYAREALLRFGKRDSTSVRVRILAARLLIREMLYYNDLEEFEQTSALLVQARAREPENADLLYLTSVLEYIARRGDPDPARRSRAGLQWVERILVKRSDDAEACLLAGVHSMDMGEMVDAERWFQRGISYLPPEAAIDFLVPPPLVAGVASLDGGGQKQAIVDFWDGQDPTPLTLLNEKQLRYWYNMTIADLYYSDPARHLHGWETQPGKSIVLFGPPIQSSFDPGLVEGGSRAIIFSPPRLWLTYETGVTLTFEDYTLHQRWLGTEGTVAFITAFERQGTTTAAPIHPGLTPRVYFMQASARGQGDRAREGCVLAIPPWSERERWWCGAAGTLRVVDSGFREVARADFTADSTKLRGLGGKAKCLILGNDFDLAPGTYTLLVDVSTPQGSGVWGESGKGTIRLPLDVRGFEGGDLQLSDIEVACPGTFDERGKVIRQPSRAYLPNPLGVVGPGGGLDLSFAVYNLARSRRGMCEYEISYMVVPAAYRRAYEWGRVSGSITEADSVGFGRSGHALGGITLTERNRNEVHFPPVTMRRSGSRTALRKMASLNLGEMEDGAYVLRVIVTDRVSGQQAQAETFVRKVAAAVLDSLVAQPAPQAIRSGDGG